MFQYAFGYTLAKRYGDELKLDIEWFDGEGNVPWLTHRKYELDKFVIPSASIISHHELPLGVRFLDIGSLENHLNILMYLVFILETGQLLVLIANMIT